LESKKGRGREGGHTERKLCLDKSLLDATDSLVELVVELPKVVDRESVGDHERAVELAGLKAEEGKERRKGFG
jgi:hypothetical protein